MIAGIEACEEGEILIEGKVANYLRPSERNVAMVFQSYALYPHMTVRENIAFPLTTRQGRHFDRATIAIRVAEAAELVDLRTNWSGCPPNFPADSVSVSRWRARSCGIPSLF